MKDKEFPPIDEVFIAYKFKGEDRMAVNEELILEILMRDDVLQITECVCHWDEKERTVGLLVNCSDMFAWACADAEALPMDELGPLYRAHIQSPKWGSTIWCCFRRKQKPQPPVIEAMKKDEVWRNDLEALPDNWQDAETQSMFAQVAAKFKKS